MADWKTPKKEAGCGGCARPFEDGEAHFSILLLGPESLSREDRCRACFEGGDSLHEDLVFWRTRRRIAAKRGLAVDFDSVERLFLALEGREEERLAELRFLLSLLLMRKKRLKLVRLKRLEGEGGEWMVLRRPRREESLLVRVFDLAPERAQALRDELERIFEGAGSEDLMELPSKDADPGQVSALESAGEPE